MPQPSIDVQGLKEAQRALRRAGGTPQDQAKLNKDAVERLIVPRAKNEVPVRTGALKQSIRSDSTPYYGWIIAGVRTTVVYGAIVHFGWSTRGLGRTVSGTRRERRDALRSALDRQTIRTGFTSRATDKAARTSFNRPGRGAVRGGPIKPNPFIYEAIDKSTSDVFQNFERQILQRAELEGLL